MPKTPTDLPAAPEPRGISIRNLRLAWGPRTLIDGFSLDAPAGSWTCLLGESGVGKTTFLRAVAGLDTGAAAQAISTDRGEPTAGLTAFMAQQDLLLPWLTATRNVALGARLRGEKTDNARIRALLEQTGVAARAQARPGELSGGERQRVALARTLMEDRPIVLMDEPFSALDAITRTRLQDLAHKLLAGRTVLMVTHDPFEALRLADRIHILGPGTADDRAPLAPAGAAPRDPADPALRETYREIMARLTLGRREHSARETTG